jgi:hypothetical protein
MEANISEHSRSLPNLDCFVGNHPFGVGNRRGIVVEKQVNSRANDSSVLFHIIEPIPPHPFTLNQVGHEMSQP